jgi:F420-dependent oxidoreductase-like protein
MRFAVMIEGQEDVSWEDWLAVAEACERLGFEALFRSDHYMTLGGARDGAALDAWGTICGLAAVTSTLRLGTLVSPATFRHPSMLAKLAVTADHISGGRVELGLGTGWNEDEHAAYGFAFPGMKTRMDRLAEQLEIVHRTWTEDGFSFEGEHWTIRDLDARPKPVQRPHPPLVMGGAAKPRSVALAARWADEYNVVHASPADAAASRRRVREGCERAGRDPDTVTFSLMHAFLIGADDGEQRDRAERLTAVGFPPEDGWPAGGPAQIAERLQEYADAGVERVMLQHLLHRDTEALELIAAEVVPALS